MASTHSTMYMTKDSTKDLEGTTMIPSLSVDFLEFGNDSGMPQMATVLPSPKATRAVEATPLVEVYSEDKSAAGGGAEVRGSPRTVRAPWPHTLTPLRPALFPAPPVPIHNTRAPVCYALMSTVVWATVHSP